MAIYKVVPGHHYTLTGLLNYTRDTKLHNGKILYNGGVGVNPKNPLADMLFLKQCFGKINGNEYYHIVVSLEADEHPKLEVMVGLFTEFANYINMATGCQVSFSVHDNTEHLHCHYVINSVIVATGHKLKFDYEMFYGLRNGIQQLLFRYGLQPLRGHEME